MAKIVTTDRFVGGEGIAKNSLDIKAGDLVAIKSGYIDKAVAGDRVEGIAIETKVFDSDNETGKKAKLQYVRLKDETQVEIDVENGTISQANVGGLFDLGANGKVDAAAASPTQLMLREVISETKGIFVRAK